MPELTITDLRSYPIKSCAAVVAASIAVDGRGFSYDRHWMVTTPDGTFLTQREFPTMALIRPSVDGAGLTVRADGAPDLFVPHAVPEARRGTRAARVWKFDGVADDEGDDAAAWFSARIGTECRLLRAGTSWDRAVNPLYAAETDRVGFADGYPILIASTASLADLNARLDTNVPMDRFRANLTVTGILLEPWAEDSWRESRTEPGVTLRVVRGCARCIMTTIDQATAEKRGPEPLRALSRFRRADGERVLFGVYAIADGSGILRVGETLTVTKTA